jgi:gliding motility-associated-like protein/uncharacterized repeat protein (TIGR01451 family)
MKKKITFYDLILKKRLLCLVFLLLLCSKIHAQTFCRPVSQTSGVSGLCVGTTVSNPNDAFDSAGLTTFTTLSTVVGVFCSAQETLVLNQTAKAGDQIVLYVGNGAGLLNLSLLSSGTIQPKFNGTNVGTALAINSPLLNVSILPGNTIGVLRYTLTGDANQVQIQLGGVVSLLTDLRIYDVRLEFAAPTVTGGLNQTICSGNSTTLTATPAAGTTVAWYSSATSTTALATTNSYTTPVLTANTTYYIGVTRAAGCEGNDRIPVNVTVSNPVAPAISTSGTAICSTGATQQTTLSVLNPVPGTTYNWYSLSSGGVALASSNTYSPIVPVGTTSFYVEAAIGSCLSPARTVVNVVSTAVPALPTVLTQSVTIQSGQNAVLNATTAEAGVTLNWYDVASGGTAIATNTSTYTTPVLVTTKTYYVEAQSPAGDCVSTSRVPVIVNVVASSSGGCLVASSQQTNINGICLLCTSTNPNYSVDGDPATAARLTVPASLVNGWIQQTLQFNNPGKAGDIIDVELELPGGLADVQLLGAVSLATYNGATFNNDRILINNPLITLQLLSGNRFKASIVAGANFDRVEIQLGGLLNLLTSVDIYQASYRYKAPVISGNTTICSGQTASLTASLNVGETINWYDVQTGGVSLANTAEFTTPVLTSPMTYYVEIARNGCVNSERFQVAVSINNPAAPVVFSGVNICSGRTATLDVDTPVPGTVYNWYDAASGGNLLFTGTSYTTPNLTASKNYFVEASIGSCINTTRTQATVNVNPLPAAPIAASSNVVIQSGQSAVLQVSSPESNIVFDWYDVPSGGTVLPAGAATPIYTTPVLTANKTFYVRARNITSDCASSERTAINVIISNTINTCLQADSQVTSKGGGITGCLLCSSSAEGASVDGNPATAATLSVPLGIVGDYIQQMLTFSTPGQAGDIIDVELGIPAGIANITALSYISLTSYNGGNPNGDQVNIGSLIDIQILSSTRLKASFVAAGPFTAVEVKLGGVATAVTSLDIYGASYRFKNATVTGATSPICNGQTATLTASSTVVDETFSWYDSASGGVQLSPNASYTTVSLNASTTYYLEAMRGGSCINSVRQPVTVTVAPFATAADVTIASPQQASCTGGIVLTPTSPLAGAQFKYYTDQNKTQEIDTGTSVAAQPGVTFSKATNGALTIAGLNAAGTPYNYYISVVNSANCENDITTLKQVTVNFPTATNLAVTSPLVGCGSVNLRNAITTFDTNTTYTFFDPSNNVITADAVANITASGVYSIQAQSNSAPCPSVKLPVTVTINNLPTLVITPPAASFNVGDDVPLVATSDGTIQWFDPQGNALPGATTGVINAPGVYTYTAVASNANCSRTGTVSINVIDPANCQLLTERVYANGQSWSSIITGGVVNEANAVDKDPKTFSTIVTGIGLLGIGTTWQNLTWPANIIKGTPVTVKLGSEYSGVTLGQNLSIVGTKNGNLIGSPQPVTGALLNLLSGDNSFEFSFVPADGSGPQDYDGIRIISSSLVSVAQNTKVFDAYYTKKVSTVACTPGDIQDVFYGATSLGIGALTATVGVSDAYNVADNDVTTYATIYSGAAIIAAADLTVQFKTPSVVTDTLRIVVSKPNVLLDVSLLTGFSIQRYLGNVAVGAPIESSSNLLSIRLLPGNTMSMVLVSSQPEPYDRVRIRFGGVAGVLEFLRVHTVERVANTKVIGSDPQNKVVVCPGSDVKLQIPPDACSTYLWYDSAVGGNVVSNTDTYTVPATLAAGVYKYYIQPVRYGCEAYARGEVTIEVRASSPENALTAITLNGASDSTICAPTGTVTLNTGLSGTPTLTNPIYYWYRFDGTTSQLIPSQTTAQLVVNGLTPGTYTYFVGVSSDEFCETNAADRKQITFTILRPSDANDIQVSDVAVCYGVPALITPTATTLTAAVFSWYFDANRTQPITSGTTVNGVTYTINSLGALSVTGLTHAMSPITYYVAVSSDTTCENLPGTLQTATVIVNDPNTPTTTDTTQDFCLVNAPTVASIQVNEPNVVWYSLPNGGTAIAPATALTSGMYYGAIKDPATGCESSVRLEVAITVNDPGTPTIADTAQEFCLVNAPTFATINVSPAVAANIVWYDAMTGGNLIASTTALTSGTYYAAIKDPTTTCESNVRLAVVISVTDPGTPVITDTAQEFCLVNAPTFATINVSPAVAANIVWYDAMTGGNLIASTTALTSGTYYAAIKDPTTTCESNVRLAIAISVTDPGTPVITDTAQEFCLVNTPTFATINVSPAVAANIVWYDAMTGGNLIASTTALTSGTYYAAIKDPVTTCESNVRLAIAISVTDPGTPTLVTTGTQNFCLVNAPTFASVQFNQTGIVWYDAMTGGNLIASTTALTSGTYYAAIKDPTTTCESNVRLAVVISVTDPGTPVITDTAQEFCLVNAPTFATINVSPAVAANIVWYDAMTGGNLIPSTTALTSGTYYAAIKDPTTTCESNVRLAITISVTDPGTPVITDTAQEFCLVNAPTFATINVSPAVAANIVWYDAMTGGNLIASTTALTSGTYYAAIKDPVTTCESNVRLAIAISVTDPGTPTTSDTTQDFCLVNAPTVANIQVNEANVVWYNTQTGGTAIALTTALSNGIYYGAILDPATNCESAARLAVTISISDPATPTTTNTTQNFCLVNRPTVANIQVNETNVVWYSTATGGTALTMTTALSGGMYYGAIKDPVTGCESSVRLQVTINVNDPGSPTTTAATQTFCLVNTPTVANIQVNETNVVWYSTATGGTALTSTTALTNGIYYGAILDPVTNCQSATRLQVTINVANPATPTTTNATQGFCITSAPKVVNIQVNEANVVWYSTPTGGTVIPSTTALASGIYYGAILDPVTGCQSATRLQVTVNINNPAATPTTNAAIQSFCSFNAPTVANIQVNQANVVWYSTATGGTALPATTALTTGTYYGAVSSTTGCENPVRLAVVVNVNTPGVITTPRTVQTFCLSKLPTLANILVNETNVVWYASATGGTPLAANTQLTAGTYYAGALNNTTNGCESATRLGVTINFENDALVQLASTDDTPCVFQGVTYSIANGKSNYVWSVTNGTITSGGGTADGSATISWSDIGPGKVTVTYVNNCDETTTKTLNVTVATCSDLTITNTVSNPTPNFGEQITFTVTVNNVGQGNFINTVVSDLLPSGYDLISSSTTAGTYNPATALWTIPTLNAGQSVTLTIVAEVLPAGDYLSVATVEISTPLDVDAANNSASVSVDPICLTVYNEFTPNNDGSNDLFRIDCIESYPNNELKVYNRYGALVYSKQHYENDWNGTANVSGVINRGDMLPTGTYFYVIDIGDGTVKKGWLSIMR